MEILDFRFLILDCDELQAPNPKSKIQNPKFVLALP